jgi:osmotically-inducible protein OsmY
VVKSDAQIRADVAEELFCETRVDDQEIAVSAHEGTVTLRGTVGSLGAKLAAARAARRVAGVRAVDDELEVRLLAGHRRDDAEVRGAVLTALSWNVLVPESVDADVQNGVVTLSGTVDHHHERDEAEATVRNLRGITEIHNRIQVRSHGMASDVGDRIAKAFRRSAEVDADNVRIEAIDGTVTLAGIVDSWAEHDAALDAAWATPGVSDVNDRLEIASWQ